jgi:transcriptional regulator with PAS, ATPase and Fis domain
MDERVRSPAAAGDGGAYLRSLDALLERVAPRNVPVLVVGETGVGKEVLVRRIHAMSCRTGPIKAVNCAAVPAELSESVLFGHERGAFTGADRQTCGVIEYAQGGTLFLDEIAELSSRGQAALLRFLEEKRFNRVGSTQERTADVRVAAATHRDLDQLAVRGTFREDLLYRLNAIVLRVPPLRERRDEIQALAEHFLHSAARDWCMAPVAITPRAARALRRYSWPGNVRQLRNVIERALAMGAPGQAIDTDALPDWLVVGHCAARRDFTQPAEPSGPTTPPAKGERSFKERLRDFEAQLIAEALQRTRGNITSAAANLGLPVRTLSYKMRRHGLASREDYLIAQTTV